MKCKDCKYWENEHACKRFPPTGKYGVYPITGPEDSCGEFTQRPFVPSEPPPPPPEPDVGEKYIMAEIVHSVTSIYSHRELAGFFLDTEDDEKVGGVLAFLWFLDEMGNVWN